MLCGTEKSLWANPIIEPRIKQSCHPIKALRWLSLKRNNSSSFVHYVPCQDRLPVWDEDVLPALSLFWERRNHLPQSEQRLVDTRSFLRIQIKHILKFSRFIRCFNNGKNVYRNDFRFSLGSLELNHTLSRSPLVWAVVQRSLPAKSTRLILLRILWSCSSPSTNSVCSCIITKQFIKYIMFTFTAYSRSLNPKWLTP